MVTELVRASQRSIGRARHAELLLVVLSVVPLTATLALWSGAESLDVEVWVLACSIAVALAWAAWGRAAPPESAVADQLDGVGRCQGAVRAAWAAEHQGLDSPLVRLLARRTVQTLARPEVRSSVMPAYWTFAALPFVAWGLFAAVLNAHRPDPADLSHMEVLSGRVAAAFEAGASAGSEGAHLQGELERLARDGAALARACETQALEPEQAQLAIAALERQASQLLEALPAESPAAQGLERALSELEAAKLGMRDRSSESRTTDPGGPIEGGPGRAEGLLEGESSQPSSPPNPPADGSGTGTSLVQDGAEGRMDEPSDPQPTGLSATTPRGSVLPPAPWWPERYADVVTPWLESQRIGAPAPSTPPR